MFSLSRIHLAMLNLVLNGLELCFSGNFARFVQQGNGVIIQQPFPVGLCVSKYSVRFSTILNILTYFIAEDLLSVGSRK